MGAGIDGAGWSEVARRTSVTAGGGVRRRSEGMVVRAIADESTDDEPSTAAVGVGVEGLEVGGVGPREMRPAPPPSAPPCASPWMRDAPSLIAEPLGISSRFFPFGGPNLGMAGILMDAALEDLLRLGVRCAAEELAVWMEVEVDLRVEDEVARAPTVGV